MVVIRFVGRSLRRALALCVLGAMRGRRVLVPVAGLLLVAYAAVLAARPALLPAGLVPSRTTAPTRSTVSAAPGRAVTAPGLPAPAGGPVETSIRLVIQRANAEQAQAIAARDPSAMRDTATDGYYQAAVQGNQSLLDDGVARITPVRIEWGPVTVSGDTATAISYETWSTDFADGTTEQARALNVYALTRQNGAWRILSDDHPEDASTAAAPSGLSGVAPANPGR